ncbi:O-fucosyltransferase 31 [Lycium ferocissimum]|uniref:O-fucosyltransferase 31 n=1 Tax=Lycium ferocissimum TaxID=112874 RepID=UPI002815C5D8|nr:O-fucosyltransferase 31 [Lycium ferocissimum]
MNYFRRTPTSRKIAWPLQIGGLLLLLLPNLFPSLFSPLSRSYPSLFSEWNAPRPMHLHLLNRALQQQTSNAQEADLWSPLPNQGWEACADNLDTQSSHRKSQLYIQVFLDGGLNQQRMGICDAVAVAKILNATLVIPYLEVNPVWQDSSSFADIFDVDHFISVLSGDVSIVKELPSDYSWSTREYYATGIRATRIKTAPVHASASWYLENVLPLMQSYGIVAIAPFSHRLAFDNLPSDIQHLRCKVNFHALVFVPHVRALGDALVSHLRSPPSLDSASSATHFHDRENDRAGAGKYVVLHLRFDKDMAAHSACDFGGGKAEKLALAKYRQVLWQGRVLNSQFTDEELRGQGRCPLTPEEIGLLLAALGFNNSTRLYLASHKVYGGEARMSALRQLFPFMEDKKSLASSHELSEVEGKASLLAAVDYYVSMQSDIFISASPGNMHNALLGHRAYKNLKTIRPNMTLLGKLFLNKSMEWSEFQQAVQQGHKNRLGQIRIRKEKQSIYTYPAPDCMCKT